MDNELLVAWTIDCFHSDDDFHRLGIAVANAFDQFGLCIDRSAYESRTGVCNRFGDCTKIVENPLRRARISRCITHTRPATEAIEKSAPVAWVLGGRGGQPELV